MAFGGLFFALKTPLNKLWWIQKLSYPPHFIHGKRWCIQKNPILTHLLNEHFFWDTLYDAIIGFTVCSITTQQLKDLL